LNCRLGFLVNLCLAHLAGAINLKNGGSKGLEYLRKSKLKPNKKFIALLSLILYKFLNSGGNV
jgi:hypothetical protein